MTEPSRPQRGENLEITHKRSKPTLRTIATIAGLAVTTVSRALSDAPQISLETRQRVHRIAREIGYLPDRAAQRLKTGRTNVIAILLDSHEEVVGFSTSIMYGIAKALKETSYHLVVAPNFLSTTDVEAAEYIIRNHLADGLIFTRTEPLDARVRLLLETGFPFICHGRTEFSTPHPYVDYDNFTFAYEATRRLIAKERRKVAVILPPKRLTFCQHILHGFMTAVREAGIAYEIPEAVDLDTPADVLRDFICSRAVAADAPEGFICPGEVSALAVISGMSDAGRTLAVDYDIVAKETSRLLTQLQPKVDTIHEDLTAAGEDLGRMLLQRINNSDAQDLHLLLPPQINFPIG
ncbi:MULTISPECIES: LacI family transcriptional regulator [unclassified Rhizobium]|uniref:LacI family transcriptional regulator n=1 Tax=unclassified Rhizobium TaxID=2613769 RepID=UPI001C83B9BE|nr:MULTISPECIES: LacI family transcriptional regulator [unclassified Rhizobium]MBX5161884.1 LacI family DNA-binding transcriptional regulator [Rhizobium sp. NZLR8]MBX5168139.1 LacI family DNA-binding transcriptional regulator [Rhizobium sp. NZLR4b]MBX5174572.1 LacI family DNA-binding transcriptional regulator [Rhizobium sp. NZLR1b]MBX5187253.1 LacI family DNA-binding transcriptional regulator [Rhizobium sp. NZLR5]MBX5193577.1 LacI family DNA-binding transcriptional regulator [Rhizobium sp. NZL